MMRLCVAIRLSVYLPIHQSTYLPVSVNRLTAAQCLYKSHHSIQFLQFALSHSTWNSGQDAMGTKKWIPGSRTFWNLPSRSMTHAICCGTTTTPTWKRGAETPTRQAHRATKWEQQHNHDMSHRVLYWNQWKVASLYSLKAGSLEELWVCKLESSWARILFANLKKVKPSCHKNHESSLVRFYSQHGPP